MSLASVEWDFSGEKPIFPDALPNFLRHVNEKRVATHDGYVWPVCRKLMVDPQSIVARMAEDIVADYRAFHALPLAAQLGHKTDLYRIWLQDQLVDHLGAAKAVAATMILRGGVA
jgi:hypothetical protein